MEGLIANGLLWRFGLGGYEAYSTLLDEKFLKKPDDNLLLELEEFSSDSDAAAKRLVRFWESECTDFNYDLFGKILFNGLEQAYKAKALSTKDFGERGYKLWQALPAAIDQKEPFWSLSYANEYLSCGDEKRAENFYEEAFEFFK